MAVIRIDTDKSPAKKEYRVVARSLNNSGQDDGKLGNLFPEAQGQIKWTAKGEGWIKKYKIRFSVPGSSANIWPFTTLADGSPVPPGFDGPLAIQPNESITLTLSPNAPADIKYSVKAEANAGKDVDDLDPMIIIRPKSMARDSTVLGVTCAVLGAMAGALLTWALR
jgi:hypothetical protein